MIVTSATISAFAYSDNGISYSLETIANNKYATITYMTSANGVANIPATVGGYPVIGVGANLFSNSSELTQVNIAEGVEAIYYRAFYNIKNNVIINLPSTIKFIGEEAFANSKILTINFPEGLEAIDTSAFENTYFFKNAVDITLPDSLKYIAEQAFAYSNITSVNIGKNTTFADYLVYEHTIGVTVPNWYTYDYPEFQNPFKGCVNCRIIEINADNPFITSVDNVIYSKNMEKLISYHGCDSIYFEDRNLYSRLPYFDELSFTIPSGVKQILPTAFAGFYVNKLTVSNSVEELRDCAFNTGTGKIGQIVFEENSSLKTIGRLAFNGAIGGNIEIPSSVEEIGYRAFNRFKGDAVTFELPSQLKTIDAYAFAECYNITEIKIPASVKTLGASVSYLGTTYSSNVFADCTKLETVIFEDNSQVEVVPNETFKNDFNIKNIIFGNNCLLKEFSDSLSSVKLSNIDFSNCLQLNCIDNIDFYSMSELKSVSLANTAFTSVPNYAFQNCSQIENITLSDKTQVIYDYTFMNCSALSNINLEHIRVIEPNAFYGCTSLDTQEIIKDKLMKITDDGLFAYGMADGKATVMSYLGEGGEVVFPDTIDGCFVTEIDENCFDGVKDNITSLVLPKYLEVLRVDNFSDMMNLKTVRGLPDTIETISNNAFSGCESLESINIPASLKTIGESVFEDCYNLLSIDLPEGLTTICDGAFYNCNSLTEIVFPDSLENLGQCINECYNLKAVTIGSEISDCTAVLKNNSASIETINISSNNIYFTSVDGVVYNKDVTEILCYPLGKSDKNFILPNTVIKISDSCFKDNKNIENIKLSDNLKEIGNFAFDSSSLKYFYFPSSLEIVGERAFEFSDLEKVEFSPDFKVKVLYELFQFCRNLSEVMLPETVKIEEMYGVFNCCYKLDKIILPKSLKILGFYNFNSTAITSITIPENVTKIGSEAFKDTKLQEIVLSGNVKTIDNRAFENCQLLKYADISGVEKLGDFAFAECINLETINLTGVIYTGKQVFYECPNLKKILFTKEEKEAYISENEFKGNETIETIVVGNSVTEIQDYAFADCTNLQNAFIADSVTTIADTAFDNCDNLNIVCEENSYAVTYAKKNSIPYTTFVVAPIPDQQCTGRAITPELNVSARGKSLKSGNDYTAVYSDNIHPGVAKVNVIGLGDYSIFAALVRFNIVGKEPTTQPPKPTEKPTATKPATTKPTSTKPATTKKPITTKPTTTKNSTAKPVTTKPITTEKSTTKPATTKKLTTKPTTARPQKTTKPTVTAPTTENKKHSEADSHATQNPTAAQKPSEKQNTQADFKTTTKKVKLKSKKTALKKPKSTYIKKIKGTKKTFKLYWKKINGVSGYQIQYSTDRRFKKSRKTVTVKGSKRSAKTFKRIKKNKKHYVRVRTYKNYKRNGKVVKVYSNWSKVKRVR